jgi:hypothetical protein
MTLQKTSIIFLLFIISEVFYGCAGSTGYIADSIITADFMKQNIFILASDSMKGRDTPSPELDSAARYIADFYKSNGIQPLNNSYTEKVGLSIVSLGEDNYFKMKKDKIERSYVIKSEFTPFDMTGNKEATGTLVFAGYGITAPEFKYDDYRNIDVHGKIVLVLRHEPGENDSTSIFKGTDETNYANVSTKVRNAIDHGAVGVLVVTDPLNHTLLTPRGFPWPSLSKFLPKDALPITLAADESKKVPVVQIGEEAVVQLFGSIDSLKNIQRHIDSLGTPASFEFSDATVALKTSTSIKDVSSQNTVGFIEGSDPILKNEIVIIGAHYDHVGYKKQHETGEDYIFNGADDNASGTCAVMATAQAFAKMPVKPKRSVLFLTFAGEEKGLFGSRSYVSNPFFPLDSTVAMLNLDMVGRNSIDTLYMVGQSRSPDLAAINSEENKSVGFTLIGDDKEIGGSDHMSFYQKNVPFLFYFSGLHPDYHTVSDGPEKIDTEKLAKVARLAFRTAWHIANESKRYTIIEYK